MRIFFLLYDCMEVLDFTGPFDVFSMANFGADTVAKEQPKTLSFPACRGRGSHYQLYSVSETGEMVTALHGLQIKPDYSFDNCPNDQIDVLLVPGSGITTVVDILDRKPELAQWVGERARQVQVVGSVCVGALFLAKAGLFDGRDAITHHDAINSLKQLAPTARVREGARYVDNNLGHGRHIVASAGVSAGIDLAFYMLREVFGEPEVAHATSVIMEYNGTQNFVYSKGATPPSKPNTLKADLKWVE